MYQVVTNTAISEAIVAHHMGFEVATVARIDWNQVTGKRNDTVPSKALGSFIHDVISSML